jgi:hypothetical protein
LAKMLDRERTRIRLLLQRLKRSCLRLPDFSFFLQNKKARKFTVRIF